jgi:hypothetical protein
VLQNRHDTWQQFCADHRALVAKTGLPAKTIHSEQRFRDLLGEGRASTHDGEVALADLSVGQWAALSQFADVFFREFESYAPLDRFPAYRRERECRAG